MRDEQGNNLYSIGKLADIVGIPTTALRFYDEQGVLKPQIRDDETGYRYYTEEQVMKSMFISEMRRLGLTVADIKALCEKSSLTFQREALINRMVLLNDELDHLLFKKAYLEELMRNVDMGLGYFESAKICRENHIPIKIKYYPATYAVTIPVYRCFYEQEKFSTTHRLLYDICEQKHLRICGPATSRFEDPGMEHLKKPFYKSQWILPVIKPEEDIEGITLFSEMWCVYTSHVGPYRNILEQYEKLMDYCAEYGLKISGNPIEEYMISCANICGSENYITNVMFPIELPE